MSNCSFVPEKDRSNSNARGREECSQEKRKRIFHDEFPPSLIVDRLFKERNVRVTSGNALYQRTKHLIYDAQTAASTACISLAMTRETEKWSRPDM